MELRDKDLQALRAQIRDELYRDFGDDYCESHEEDIQMLIDEIIQDY